MGRGALPAPLARRLLAEFVGTGLLVTVVVGSGIAAANLTPGDAGLQLFYNSTATVFGLAVLILMLGPVSGAHFNPVVSGADWLLGRRAGTGLTGRDASAYGAVQTVGAVVGAVLANVMFDVPTAFASKDRSDWHLWVSEVVATAGLVALVFALARSGRGAWAAPAVGAYLGAAYWFTSSTSFANPAVTVGRMFSDTFAGITPPSVPGFVIAQLAGAAAGLGLVRVLYPDVALVADQVVVPHHHQQPRDGGSIMTDKPSILFACKANAGRSASAKVLAEYYARDRVEVFSAGSEPGDRVHPEVADVLSSLGLDASGEVPKAFDPDGAYTAVVTMGCGEACPFYTGASYDDWELDDPQGQEPDAVRRIVRDIDHRVRALLADLVPDLQLPSSVFAQPAHARTTVPRG
jgi:arsenate reductase